MRRGQPVPAEQVIAIFDERRQQWRALTVQPPYLAVCGNGLHQFDDGSDRCGCRQISRWSDSEDRVWR